MSKIVEVDVQPIFRRLFCEDCDVEMTTDNNVKTSDPPQYDYKCPNCGKEETHPAIYPHLDFKKVDEE